MENNKEISENWSRIGQILTGEASEEEQVSFYTSLSQDKQLLDDYIKAKNAWEHAIKTAQFEGIDVAADWLKIEKQLKRGGAIANTPSVYNFRKTLRWAGAIAAAAILLISAVILWPQITGSENKIRFTNLDVPRGSRISMQLEDGTHVWLNAGSHIRYSSDYGKKNREIFLEGEAFFDVTKKEIPFIVKTSSMNIRVLGTAFNVKCYKDEKTIETTLVRGSLKIEKRSTVYGPTEEILLKPNQKVILFKEEQTIQRKNTLDKPNKEINVKQNIQAEMLPIKEVYLDNDVDTKTTTSWKEGLLIIRGETLESLARKLGRRYDVEFVFEDHQMRNYKYSGTIKELSLEQMLNAIKMTSPISFEIHEKKVIIKENIENRNNYKTITTN